ncbi:unnamed protein product [Arabidopsis thaliana]|uniref:Uncharacterized protein n=1 Tax=Arabidopsis thaliana TaxID=3702 RepID=A0A654G545_ARATH|nr:unnamed protein product [Arabidopsis thaliana]
MELAIHDGEYGATFVISDKEMRNLTNKPATTLIVEQMIGYTDNSTSWQGIPQADVILRLYSAGRWTPDKECLGTDFDKTLLNVVMAAFIFSMRTLRNVDVKRLLAIVTNQWKITNRLVEDVIASPWISPPELKFLFASFHDIGVAFYNNKHLEKASMVFKLCIRTVWTCVRLLCQIYVNKSDLSEDCLPKEAIIDFVSEACSKSAFYLDVLHQHGARETEKLHVFILENWPEAEDLIKKLPDPTPIVKQWVKAILSASASASANVFMALAVDLPLTISRVFLLYIIQPSPLAGKIPLHSKH